MKFQCERCKTRYSIADEKVRGKILKIRCKNCESVISVREGMEPPPPRMVAEEAAPSAEMGPQSTIPITSAIASAIPAAPAPAPAPAPPVPANLDEEWFVAVDGAQEGPFSLEEARARVAKRQPDEEMFGWREDFDEWLPVEQIPQLAPSLPKAKKAAPPPPPQPIITLQPQAPAPPPAPAPAPANGNGNGNGNGMFARDNLAGDDTGDDADEPEDDVDPFAAVSSAHTEAPPREEHDGFDFNFSEVSRVVRMPVMPAADGPAAIPARKKKNGEALPGIRRAGRGTGSAASLGARAQVGVEIGPEDATIADGGPPMAQAQVSSALPITYSSEPLPAAAPAPATGYNFGANIVGRAPRRRTALYAAIGGVALLVIVLVIVLGTRGSSSDKPGNNTDPSTSNDPSNTFDYGKGVFATDPNRPKAPVASSSSSSGPVVTSPESAAASEKKPKNPTTSAAAGSQPNRVARIDSPPKGTEGATSSTPKGKEDTFVESPGDSKLAPLSPDDVRDVYNMNELSLKMCYEHALKIDPATSVSKMDVSVTIGPSGQVTRVAVPNASSALSKCLATAIRAWRFRKSTGDFNTEFTVFFAKRG